MTETERVEKQYRAWADRQPRPSEKLIDHIENVLDHQPCVGSLQRWSRTYAYNMLPERTVDTGIVDFNLEEIGGVDVKPGRHITAPDSWVNLDDRPIRFASGDFDVKENRIRIMFCGNNSGGSGKGDINNRDAYFQELKQRRSAHAHNAR